MIATLLFSAAVFGLAALGLAAGLLLGRGPIRGSCGGLACGGRCAACPRRATEEAE